MKNEMSVISAVRSPLIYRGLILQMAKREILGRYRGSVGGLAWSFLNPLLMLLVYTFVFSYVFNSRWGGDASGGRAEFSVILFAGIMIHGFLSECMMRAPSLITGNASYVKKIVFPLEILAWTSVVNALFHMVITLFVLLTVQYIFLERFYWTALYFPFVVIPFVFMAVGITWFFAALGVYYRDIGQITGLLATVLLFMSPALYPLNSLPAGIRQLIYLNPVSFIIEQSRAVLVWGVPPDWAGLSKYCLASLSIAYLGYYWFQLVRKGFADVV